MSIYHLGVTSSVVSESSGASTRITQQAGEPECAPHPHILASFTQQTPDPFICPHCPQSTMTSTTSLSSGVSFVPISIL